MFLLRFNFICRNICATQINPRFLKFNFTRIRISKVQWRKIISDACANHFASLTTWIIKILIVSLTIEKHFPIPPPNLN
jgi:hypothetical protein